MRLKVKGIMKIGTGKGRGKGKGKGEWAIRKKWFDGGEKSKSFLYLAICSKIFFKFSFFFIFFIYFLSPIIILFYSHR